MKPPVYDGNMKTAKSVDKPFGAYILFKNR